MCSAIRLAERFIVAEGRIEYVVDDRAHSLRALDTGFRRLPCHKLSHSRLVAGGDYRPRVLPGGRQTKPGDSIARGIIARRVRESSQQLNSRPMPGGQWAPAGATKPAYADWYASRCSPTPTSHIGMTSLSRFGEQEVDQPNDSAAEQKASQTPNACPE